MVIERKADTSSIGPQWPPQESSFNRIKGINTSIIDGSDQLSKTVNLIEELKQKHIDSDSDQIDRISIRIVVNNKTLIENLDMVKGLSEVIIPLFGTNSNFENASLLYLGCNSTTRQSDQSDLEKAISNVETASKKGPVSFEEAIVRAKVQGFTTSILELDHRTRSSQVQDQMTRLYERFGWERKEVLDILSKPSNVIAVASTEGTIVSAGIAEISSIKFDGGAMLRMAEITEAATDEKFQGKGLYSSVAARLMLELVDLSHSNQIDGGQIDLAFGECNGNEPGVLKAVKSLGRTFSFEICKSLSLPFKGFLSQHVPIAGAARNTPYNDLFPAFITRETLFKLSK